MGFLLTFGSMIQQPHMVDADVTCLLFIIDNCLVDMIWHREEDQRDGVIRFNDVNKLLQVMFSGAGRSKIYIRDRHSRLECPDLGFFFINIIFLSTFQGPLCRLECSQI